MAKEGGDFRSEDLQIRHNLNENRSPTPESLICLPPTPPVTDERGRLALDMSAVDGALRVLNTTKNPTTPGRSTPCIRIKITKQQYDQFSEKLDRCNHRFDHEPRIGLLTIRIPSPVHDFFSAHLSDDVKDWLRSITSCGGESGEFASKIVGVGSSRIFLKEGLHHPVRRQPDAQFQHRLAAYPGLVIEVSYSQDGKNLQKLAQDYILYSNGNIKAVIGIDINYGGMESTVSLWRPKYSYEVNEPKVEYLEIRQDVANKPFRSANGAAINEDEHLRIKLSDFATDAISSDYDKSASLCISFRRLHNLLHEAEEIQQAREPMRGQGGIKSNRPTKRRRISSSPVDQLMPGDEETFINREIEALRRTEAADEDFEEPAAKRGDSGSRRVQA